MAARTNARRSPRSVPRTATPLDQGIAISGEVRIKLFGMTLLPIQVRLLISSSALAQALGVSWWPNPAETDPSTQSRNRSRRGAGTNGNGASTARGRINRSRSK